MRLRAAVTLMLAVLLAACGGPAAKLDPSALPTRPVVLASDLAVAPLPGPRRYSLLILVADGVYDAEVIAVQAAATALGMSVRTAGVQTGTIVTRHGLELPVDLALVDVELASFELLFIPGGLPKDEQWSTHLTTFLREALKRADRHLFVTTASGQGTLAALPELALRHVATPSEGIFVDGPLASAARIGELGRLCFALEAVARDRWPR